MTKKPPGFGYPTVLEFTDKSILDYFDVLTAMSPRTATAARDRPSLLPKFVKAHYDGLTVDELVDALKAGGNNNKLDRYQVMSRFAVYLKRDCSKSDDRTRKMIMQAKLFLEHSGVEFSERAFRSSEIAKGYRKETKSCGGPRDDHSDPAGILQPAKLTALYFVACRHRAQAQRAVQFKAL
jgi:hypothetical protein